MCNSGKIFNYFICLILFCIGCSNTETVPNTLSEKEIKENWKLLFNGKNLQGWHLYNQNFNKNISSAWVAGNGIIYCDPNVESNRIDLISNEEYENYELKFDWKLEKEGNSGVFINVKEDQNISTTYYSGPEYQLLSDDHMDYNLPLKKAGCLYNFTPQLNTVRTKLKGEWNHSKIIQKNGKIEFYLNEQLTAKMDFNSKEWETLISKSNFKDQPHFGKYTKGRIALQDWSRGVSFRNIKIKEL